LCCFALFMLRFRAYLIIIHIAGWLLFMALPLLFMNARAESDNFHLLSLSYYWLFCATYILLFYFNSLVLIPFLFFKKRYVIYSVIVLILLAGVYFLQPYDRLVRSNEQHLGNTVMQPGHPAQDYLQERSLPPPPPPNDEPGTTPRPMDHHPGPGGPPPGNGVPPRFPHPQGLFQPRHNFDIISFFLFIMVIALSTAIRVMRQWQLSEQRAIQAEADKTSAELSFLKAQINPHFLFNTLNNIYTLAVVQDEHAPESILKLSNIMRYVTDDAMDDFVPLENEIDCIKDYIELQKLRFGSQTIVDLKISGDVENKSIAPLILMTFVENVFKYGISKHEPSLISIGIMSHENGISFYCQNKIFGQKTDSEREGVGLKNARRRLSHLYAGRHVLNINTDSQSYTVNLILKTR
jgi:two-component system LytT family sensor kinase